MCLSKCIYSKVRVLVLIYGTNVHQSDRKHSIYNFDFSFSIFLVTSDISPELLSCANGLRFWLVGVRVSELAGVNWLWPFIVKGKIYGISNFGHLPTNYYKAFGRAKNCKNVHRKIFLKKYFWQNIFFEKNTKEVCKYIGTSIILCFEHIWTPWNPQNQSPEVTS